MKKIDFDSTENHLSKNLHSVGSSTHKIVKKLRKDDETVSKILNSNKCLYSQKVPQLNNNFLKTVAAIDPMTLAKSTVTLKATLHLLEIVTSVLPSTDQNANTMKRSAE